MPANMMEIRDNFLGGRAMFDEWRAAWEQMFYGADETLMMRGIMMGKTEQEKEMFRIESPTIAQYIEQKAKGG